MYSLVILAQIGVGWIFIRWLLTSDRGPKEPRKLLILAGVFGALAVGIALFLEQKFLPDSLLEDTPHLGTSQLLGFSLAIGLIEEAAKAVPLAIFLLARKHLDEVTDGLIYFGISGMVFGVIEDIGYALALGPGTGIAKIVTGPFIHAGFCVLIGWAIASWKVQKRSFLWVPFGFIAAIGLHGLYDFGLFYGHAWTVMISLAITALVNINILLLYQQARKADAKLGIGAADNNLYCSNCGRPNPDHYVFCTACGQRT